MEYSVITISLDSARTIGRTVESVLCQTRLPAQYIFVDGGSTDGTQIIIEDCQRRCVTDFVTVETTVLLQHERAGIADAWNVGLGVARGDIVFILNSDDWYESDCAERVMDHFNSNPEVDIVIGATRLYTQGRWHQPKMCGTRPMMLFPFLNPILHPACFIRRRVYQNIGLYDTTYRVASDYDLLYRCRRNGCVILKDQRIVVNRESGGYAERNRRVSRVELNAVARKYCTIPLLPDLSYYARVIAGR